MNSKKRIVIKGLYNSVFLGLLMLPFFAPSSLYSIAPALNRMLNMWEIVSFVIVLVLYLFERKVSRMFLAIITYQAVLLFSTYMGNSSDYWRLAVSYGEVISLCMLIETAVKHNPKALIRAMLYVLAIECTVNLLTVILYPNGMYREGSNTYNWLLGYDNKHQLYILPLLCVFLIYTTYKRRPRVEELAGIVLFSASPYITWSATAVVVFTVYILLIILLEFDFQVDFIKGKKGFFISVAFFLAIVVFRVQNLFAFLIVGILHKDLTFTNRTRGWDRALKYFMDNMLLGVGQHSREENTLMIGLPHPHNLYLRVLYETGIAGAVCFTIIILLALKKLMKYPRDRYCYILSVTLFCFSLAFQVEAPEYMTTFFGIIMLGYHIDALIAGMAPEHRKRIRLLNPNVRIRIRRPDTRVI